jgi:hypothetical protein
MGQRYSGKSQVVMGREGWVVVGGEEREDEAHPELVLSDFHERAKFCYVRFSDFDAYGRVPLPTHINTSFFL